MTAVGRLKAELPGVEARLAEECLCLAHGWDELEVAVNLGHSQHESAHARGGKSAAEARETSERTLREVEAAIRLREAVEAREQEL